MDRPRDGIVSFSLHGMCPACTSRSIPPDDGTDCDVPLIQPVRRHAGSLCFHALREILEQRHHQQQQEGCTERGCHRDREELGL